MKRIHMVPTIRTTPPIAQKANLKANEVMCKMYEFSVRLQLTRTKEALKSN